KVVSIFLFVTSLLHSPPPSGSALRGWCWLTSKPVNHPHWTPVQFAYCQNRSMEDAISTSLHAALSYLDNGNTDARLLFIDFSSAFNTIIPSKLITKLSDLSINTSLRNWILDFLTNRPQ